MGFKVTSSSFCFLVFFCLINFIKDVIPPLSPLFIPSISSITIAIFLTFPHIICNTLRFDILLLVIVSISVLLRTSPASYLITS